MLVLSRKAGEKIVINNEVEITVTRIQNGRVQIGVAAPPEVNIRRAELPEWSNPTIGGRHDAKQRFSKSDHVPQVV